LRENDFQMTAFCFWRNVGENIRERYVMQFCWCNAAFKNDIARSQQFIGYDAARLPMLALKLIHDSS